MQIKLNLNIFLFLILFVLTNQLELYALMMTFALLHELAHLICGILLGFLPETLHIMPLGFYIVFKTNIADHHGKILKPNQWNIYKKIGIAIAGPAFNLLIVLIGIGYNINQTIVYANLLIFLFNMLPIYPLDGGRIMKNIFQFMYKPRKARKLTNTISKIVMILLTMVASIAIYIYQNIAIFGIISFLWMLVLKENKKYRTYSKIYKIIDKSQNYL